MNTTYIFSKIFTYSVLPPGMFILLLFLSAFYSKRFRFLFMSGAILFYALSNTFVADALLRPLEKPFNKSLHVSTQADAVVVLGGGHIEGSSNLPLSEEAYKRALLGIMIAKSNNLPLLFSGAGINAAYTESDAFLESAKELSTYLGLDIGSQKPLSEKEFSLHVESKSLDTYENAKLSKRAFEQVGIEKPTIYLVTSAYHMKRSLMLYKHFGFTVIPAATAFKISSQRKNALDYLPNIWSFEKSYIALHEYAGLLSLRLRGVY